MHEQYIADQRDCTNNLDVYRTFRDHMTHMQWEEVLSFLADCYPGMNKVDRKQFKTKAQNWLDFIDSNGFWDLPYDQIVDSVSTRNRSKLKSFYEASWGLVVMAIEQFDHHDNYPHKATKTLFNQLFDIETKQDDNPFSALAIGNEYANLSNLLRKK